MTLILWDPDGVPMALGASGFDRGRSAAYALPTTPAIVVTVAEPRPMADATIAGLWAELTRPAPPRPAPPRPAPARDRIAIAAAVKTLAPCDLVVDTPAVTLWRDAPGAFADVPAYAALPQLEG